jgi:tetratricopeptide (TPR) repeat protein
MTEQAVDACYEAARLDNDNGFYMGRLAHLLLTVGRVDEGLEAARRAVEYAPGASLSYRVLGDALRSSGANEDAIAAYRRSLELDPENRRSIDALNSLLGS